MSAHTSIASKRGTTLTSISRSRLVLRYACLRLGLCVRSGPSGTRSSWCQGTLTGPTCCTRHLGHSPMKVDGKVAASLRVLVVVASLAAARAQQQIRVCDEENRCTLVPAGRSSTSTRTETNSRFIGFGIVTAVGILVVANVLICVVRCIFQRRPSQQERAAPRVRIWSSRSLPVISRPGSVKQVYVLNPAGSLKLGKKDSRKVLSLSGALGREYTASGGGERTIPLVSASSWIAQEEAAVPADRGSFSVNASVGEGAEDLAERGLVQDQGGASRGAGTGTADHQDQVVQEQV